MLSSVGTNKSFPSMILVNRFPEWLFGYNVKIVIPKDPWPSGAFL
jgi:hypothetical protein